MKVGVLFMTLTSGQNDTGNYIGKYKEILQNRLEVKAKSESQKGLRFRETDSRTKLAM